MTRPPARHDMAATRKTGDASHARPPNLPEPQKPALTRPRSFRDDRPAGVRGVTCRRNVSGSGGSPASAVLHWGPSFQTVVMGHRSRLRLPAGVSLVSGGAG